MKKKIDRFEGLYGQTGRDIIQSPLYSERLETRSHSFNWEIRPHIHPARLQIFFIESGEFEYQVADRKRVVQSPCLILIPAAVLHGFIFNPTNSGRILSISNTLIDDLFREREILTPVLGSPLCITSFTSNWPCDRIGTLLETIDEELFGDQKERDLMLRINIQQLFLVIYRLWVKDQETEPTEDRLDLKHFRKVQALIRQKEGRLNVAQLAEEVGVSKVHLNRVCNQVAGKSAGELIHEYILSEACKYLNYTSYSVSEIAYILGFEYPNYFARFIKKHTGLSPVEFREKGGIRLS
ncbi:helix-turn-helix domain-containing protein [Desertivirga brevis]|uniref:helix-turn-helix domain-containing protein n=1 Tax=Desertivirga brevis TaxID=2810310 RepID=UPI001A9655B7|nr:helix-turn-helix domain-containing protein [Pedobacter sp. SYSU D00873]